MIRLANPDDAPAILDIYAPIVRDTPISFEYEPPSVDEMRARIEKVLAVRPWLVFEQDGVVLGYTYATTFRERRAYDWGVESAIYVRAQERGKGIGPRLYRTLFEILRAQNYCTVVAGATMPNEATERLHRSMGFTEFGRYPAAGFKHGCWYDVVFWYKRLRDLPATPPAIIPYNEIIHQWLQ